MPWPTPAYANAVIDERRLDIIELDAPGMKSVLTGGLYTTQIATIPNRTELLAIPGSAQDGLLQVGNDILLMQGSVLTDGRYILHRLGCLLRVLRLRELQPDRNRRSAASDRSRRIAELFGSPRRAASLGARFRG